MSTVTELTKSFKANIQGRDRVVKLTITRYHHKKTKGFKAYVKYSIKAVVMGPMFDLCHLHYGYLKRKLNGNPRLRSNNAIKAEMSDIYESFKSTIKDHGHKFIVERGLFKGLISRKYLRIENVSIDDRLIKLENVNSLESSTCISWHYKDVFKEGDVDVILDRSSEGQLKIYVSESDLYDVEKLKALKQSDGFKNKDLAFFKYNEVLRLLGEQFDGPVKAMSGLFRAS